MTEFEKFAQGNDITNYSCGTPKKCEAPARVMSAEKALAGFGKEKAATYKKPVITAGKDTSRG